MEQILLCPIESLQGLKKSFRLFALIRLDLQHLLFDGRGGDAALCNDGFLLADPGAPDRSLGFRRLIP
jgi:hypothetical protein